MLKLLDKMKILGLITTMFLVSCIEEEVVLGPESFDNYAKFAAMNNYSSPIFDNTTLHLADNGSIMSHDNTLQVYAYIDQFEDDNSKAIYNARLPKDTRDRFFIVEVIGGGKNKVLDFYYEKSGTSVNGFYWTDKEYVEKDFKSERVFRNNLSDSEINYLDIAPKTKYIYPKDDYYINLLQTGTIVYHHDESIVIFNIVIEKNNPLPTNRAKYKSEGNNYLGVEVVGIGDDKDIKFYFNKKDDKDDESIFWQSGAIKFDEDNANIDIFPKTFVDNARKYGYQFALEDKTVNLHDNGTITNFSDSKALFTYNSQPDLANNAEAVYKEVESGKFVGIKIVGENYDDQKLEAYFKNSNGVAGFWDRAVEVKHLDNNLSMLATRQVGMESSATKVIPATTTDLPTVGTQLSTLIVDNTTYVLSQAANGATLSYTADTTDNPAWDSTVTAGAKVMSSSLQSIGKDVFATVIRGGNVEVLKLKPGLAPLSSNDGSSYINEKNSKAINATRLATVADNNTLYVASSDATGTTTSRKDKDSKDLLPFGGGGEPNTITTVMSAVLSGDGIYTAGRRGAEAKVFYTRFAYAGHTEISGNLPNSNVTNISLVSASDKLYAAVTESNLTDIYLYSSDGNAWTKQTLPTITGSGDVQDIQLISKGDNLYFSYKNGTTLYVTPLRITESGSLSLFAGGAMTSYKIENINLDVIAGITIVDNSIKANPNNADPFVANPDKFLPTGDIYITYVSSDSKLTTEKLNMEDHGAFELPTQ